MRNQPALASERVICLQARRGLAIYFAVLVPLSATFETLMILGSLSWFWALMWTPAGASIVARIALREGLADVSFCIRGSKVWRAVLLALIFPVVLALISYGIAWAIGLVQFSPQIIPLAAHFVHADDSPLMIFVINLVVAASIVTIFSVRTAAGEEIGWRGYMLTRMIDAGVPWPIFASGLIWGFWHVPLILGGVYLTGPPPALSALLWMVTASSFSFVFARLRLESGSIWPVIALHAAWNSVIQVAFDPASKGADAPLWVGETGILVSLTMTIAGIFFACRWRTGSVTSKMRAAEFP